MIRFHQSALALALLLGASPALAQEKMSILPGDNPKAIAYTPCEPNEEAGECIAYILSCESSEAFGSGLELMIIGQGTPDDNGPDTRAIARTLLDKPYGESKFSFDLNGTPVELTAHNIVVSSNELNGDWDVAARSMDLLPLLDAMTSANTAKASATIGGYTVALSAGPPDAEVLMKFKKACIE